MKDSLPILNEAEGYTRTAVNSFQKKKFDNKFLLNLATMAFEKYMVAYLMSKDNLPEGHTLSYLVGEMTKYTSIPLNTIDLLETLDDKIQLCSLENTPAYLPTDKEMDKILSHLLLMKDIVKEDSIQEV